MKYDIGVNYRVNDDLEASLVYRKGGGNTIYTGAQKYALRNFGQQFFKLGLESSKMKFKIYQSITDAGDSYNIGALGAIMNEVFSPSAPVGTSLSTDIYYCDARIYSWRTCWRYSLCS